MPELTDELRQMARAPNLALYRNTLTTAADGLDARDRKIAELEKSSEYWNRRMGEEHDLRCKADRRIAELSQTVESLRGLARQD